MNPLQWISEQVPFGNALIEFIPIALLASALFSMSASFFSGLFPGASTASAQTTPYSQWQQQGSPVATTSKYYPPQRSSGQGGYTPNNTGSQTTQRSVQSGSQNQPQPQRKRPSSRLAADPMGSEPVISLDDLKNIEIKTNDETERGQL